MDAALQIDGTELAPTQLAVLPPGKDVEIRAMAPGCVMICGGDPLDGERHLYWNFVSSSRERIDRAKADWKGMRFGTVPGDAEFIPLPDY